MQRSPSHANSTDLNLKLHRIVDKIESRMTFDPPPTKERFKIIGNYCKRIYNFQSRLVIRFESDLSTGC